MRWITEHLRRLTLVEWLSLGGIALMLIALLVPNVEQAGSGSYELRVTIAQEQPLDIESLRSTNLYPFDVPEVMTEAFARTMIAERGRVPSALEESGFTVDVRTTGRPRTWRSSGTYHQERLLVIGYRFEGEVEQRVAWFEIPDGREQRELSVRLPTP